MKFNRDTSYYDDVRKYTNKMIDMLDEGILDSYDVCVQLLNYLSEDEVEDFMHDYGYDKSNDIDESLTEAKKNPAYNNIRKVAKAMNWRMPMFVDPSAYGYLTWKNITNDQVEEIKEKTGLDVKLARSGRLIVPRSGSLEEKRKLKEDYINDWSFAEDLEEILPKNLRYKVIDVINNNLYWVAQEPFKKEELRDFSYAIDEYGFDNVYVILRDDSTYNFEEDLKSGKMYKIDPNGNIGLVVEGISHKEDEIDESFKNLFNID